MTKVFLQLDKTQLVSQLKHAKKEGVILLLSKTRKPKMWPGLDTFGEIVLRTLFKVNPANRVDKKFFIILAFSPNKKIIKRFLKIFAEPIELV